MSRFFLCLWHVRKAWAYNVVKKITIVEERAIVLNLIGTIMYSKGCKVDEDHVLWASSQLDKIATSRPRATSFMKYMNGIWRGKIDMWVVGARRIPHVGQNTNAAIESYQSNLKSILNSTRKHFVGRRMDWLIYHLLKDVITHYWYRV